MHCELNSEVDCFWMRNGFHVEITDRYQYINGKNGLNSSDCTLSINNVQPMDITFWQCGSMATSIDPGTLSEKVWLKANGTVYSLLLRSSGFLKKPMGTISRK